MKNCLSQFLNSLSFSRYHFSLLGLMNTFLIPEAIIMWIVMFICFMRLIIDSDKSPYTFLTKNIFLRVL